jgi:dTDP-glucose 4,6-dehydratase
LVEGINRLLLSNHSDPVNVGNPDEITISEFAEEIIALTGTTQKVIYKDLPIDDPMQRQPNIDKARSILKWEPKVNRADGLKITYDYFRSLPEDELYKKEHNTFEGYIRK